MLSRDQTKMSSRDECKVSLSDESETSLSDDNKMSFHLHLRWESDLVLCTRGPHLKLHGKRCYDYEKTWFRRENNFDECECR